MLTREAPPFIWVLSTCERVAALVEFDERPTDDLISEGGQEKALFHLRTMEQTIDGMDLKATTAAVRRTIAGIEAGKMTLKLLGDANRDIYRRFQDEMEGRHFFILDAREADFFDCPKPLFGERVEASLPVAAFDIDEAAKSFALGRYTACVFHLMRAMEVAVAVLGDKLGATVKNKHDETLPWGVLVANMKEPIERLPKREQDKWLRAHSLLHSANRAYRTGTAHPASKYTPEEAEVAIHATKSFMREFAELL
jgi:HEPN domain-containing protein